MKRKFQDKVCKSIYLEKNLNEQINKLAKADNRSYSCYVIHILTIHCKQAMEAQAQAKANNN